MFRLRNKKIKFLSPAKIYALTSLPVVVYTNVTTLTRSDLCDLKFKDFADVDKSFAITYDRIRIPKSLMVKLFAKNRKSTFNFPNI